MKVAILAIGTELTTGQIQNSNAHWFAKNLKAFGVETRLHLAVPDDRDLIIQAFEFGAKNSEWIFVTGGLGPTSDDFTRNVFSQWAKLDLKWDEDSWQHLNERLSSRGIAVKDIQRQQCYFPEGAKIYTNRMGTANGFAVVFKNIHFFFLPGPPKEIQAIWNDYLEKEISAKVPVGNVSITHAWDLIGIGESEVAEKVIAATHKFPKDFQSQIGYRVHLPYVEVKLSYQKLDSENLKDFHQAIEQALGPLTVLRDGEDITDSFAHRLKSLGRVKIRDGIPGGFLLQRFFPHAKDLLKSEQLELLNWVDSPGEQNPDAWVFSVYEQKTGDLFEAIAEVTPPDRSMTERKTIPSRYSKSLMREREQQYFAEMALLFWVETLKKHSPS
jgi:nicotinamide-nucleotide amidase